MSLIPPTAGADPNDQMVEPTIGNEDMDAWLSSLNDGQQIDLPSLMATPLMRAGMAEEGGTDEPTDDEPDEESVTDDDTPSDDGTPPEGTGQEIEGTDYVTINGNRFDRADIERLYHFDQYMRSNPDAAQRVAEAIATSGQSTLSTTQTQASASQPTPAVEEWKDPEPPDFLDLDDPQAKFMWENHVSTQRALFDRDQRDRQFQAQQQQAQSQQIQRQASEDMSAALTRFRDQFPGLNDEDIATVRQNAGPFISGMMQTLPPVDALFRSMEVAAYSDNELRTKLVSDTPEPTTRQRSAHRKQRLGSIAGTPRSAPKVESKPSFTTDRDMVSAFANALSDQMTGR